MVRYKAKVEKLQRRKYELDLMSYRARQLQSVLAWKDAAGLVRLTPSSSARHGSHSDQTKLIRVGGCALSLSVDCAWVGRGSSVADSSAAHLRDE